MVEAVKKYSGVDFNEVKTDEEAIALAKKHHVELPEVPSKGAIIAEFFDAFVEENLIQPTFIYDYPVEISPLAKRKPEDKEKWSLLTDGYFTKNKNIDLLRLVVQLIDSRIGPTADDEMMLSFLSQSEIPFLVVATKADKLNATEKKKSAEMFANHPLIPKDTPVLFCSSLKNEGKNELWAKILEMTALS